ncbi:MAG TPA: enoyl-CoA hydratase/isomerase family protein [Thermoplasmata archaeon]|nr:enoyl-CoA hydratase/isomerase family protein [Thermoplasmata archaeon]
MSPGQVRLETAGALARLVLDAPPENSLALALVGELGAAVGRADKEPGVRVAVLTGAGGTFSAGTDLRDFGDAEPKRALTAAQLGQDVAWRIEHSEKVWIAAVEGIARGGGLDLALACDLLVAGEDARFESPEVGEGWIPFFGGTQRLRHALGKARAREAILTGAPISARDGHAIGFVNRVVPKGRALATAESLAGEIAKRPWPAVRAAKKVLVEQLDKPYRNGFLLEAQYLAQLVVDRKKT